MTADKDLKFYMEVDVVKSSSEDEWVFEGLASTSNLDLFGDVVYPESFQNSIEFFKSNGKIFYNHNYARKDVPIESQTPIGVPLDATIRDGGLYIKAALNKSHPLAQKIWHEFLTNPDPKFNSQIGLSIGAKALGSPRREYSPKHGKVVNFLPDLLLYEVSMTPTPVNPDTKTWVSVLKSVMNDVEDISEENIIETHVDDAVFDPNRNLLLVKSTVESEDGTVYAIETYVNVKDEVRKAIMADEQTKKPGQDDAADDASAGLTPGDAGGAETTPPADAAAPGADAGAEGNPFGGGDEATPGGDEGALPGADDAGEGALPGADAGAGDMGGLLGGDSAGGDPLADPTGEGTDPGQDVDSASVAMLSDKIDTIQDAIISMANDIATLVSKDQGGAVEGTTTPPVDNTVIKSADFSSEEFRTVLTNIVKSVVSEALAPVLNQSVMVQKSTDSTSSTPEVVVPRVALSTGNNQGNNTIIVKSAYNDEPIELDHTVLKGLLSEFVSIRGSAFHDSTRRGEVIYKAEQQLGITGNQFRRLVQEYTSKGEVKI